ncbi:class I SAM-dependent methyltransferase [Candidatus Woesearchaeota archaeon]|jgi:SAM-dependent methyltransferase|nr:class I SAM-dependent methyltransferase [Candidatus Woesearchaeota archaeon]
MDKKQKIQAKQYFIPYHYLDLFSEEYKYLNSLIYLAKLKLVKYQLKPFRGQSILDLGCGDGRMCYELKDENLDLLGIDLEENAILFARAFSPNVKFKIEDIYKMKLNKKFDAIILLDVLEHLYPKEIPKVLKIIKENLTEKGKLIITVPTKNLELHKKHYQHFDDNLMVKTLMPYFKVKKSLGYSRTGFKNMIFSFLKWIGLLFYVFRYKFKIIYKYYEFLENFCMNNLALGKADNSFFMLVVAEKV